MKKAIQSGDTVSVHYTGKLENGEVFDSSSGRRPLTFTVGCGQIIRGFDEAVVGMTTGEKKTVTIAPEMAYGPANMPVDVVESIWPRSRQSAGIDVPRPLPYGGNGMGFAFAPLIGTGVSWIGGLFNRPDKWQTQALPLLSQIVQRSGRPAICAWFGDIQGLDQNLQPLVLAGGPGDITHDQYGVIAAEWAKRNGLLYGLWLETVRAWHPDGSTSTHGSYNLESGQLSFTPAGPGSTVIPGGGVTPTGASGPISTNTMLLLGAGAVALYLIAKR